MEEGGTPLLPDSLVYQIFLSLGPTDVLAAGLVCRQWQAVSRDEFLWREQFYRYYQVARDVPRHPAATSWYEEFQRLYDTVPCVEVQTLREHTDQVLHLSFSHSGYQFASCSKDCTVKVRGGPGEGLWPAAHPGGKRGPPQGRDDRAGVGRPTPQGCCQPEQGAVTNGLGPGLLMRSRLPLSADLEQRPDHRAPAQRRHAALQLELHPVLPVQPGRLAAAGIGGVPGAPQLLFGRDRGHQPR